MRCTVRCTMRGALAARGLVLIAALLLVVSAAQGRLLSGRWKRRHLELRPLYAKPCPGNNIMEDVRFEMGMQGRTSIVFNISGTITRTVNDWRKGLLTVYKCSEMVSDRTCTVVDQSPTDDVCARMTNRLMPWSPIVRGITPPVECPMKAGRYSLSNSTVDMGLFNAIASTMRLEGYIWRVITGVFDGDGERFLCVDGAAEFFRVKNKPTDRL